MSLLNVDKVDPSTGTTLTLGTSGDTVSIPSGVTIANSGTATGFGTTINNNADNRVITGSDSANTLEGEANLTFSAGTLAVNGGATFQNDIDLGEYNITNVGTVSCDGLLADTTNMTINSDDASGVLTLQTNSNTALYIDSAGHVTKALQSAFFVNSGSGSSDMSLSTGTTTINIFDDERWDQNADFASNTFTAPVTGKYLLGSQIYFNPLGGDKGSIQIITSNVGYFMEKGVDSGGDGVSWEMSVLADMDASDTAVIKVYVNGSSTVKANNIRTNFFGSLIC
mgnify:CR=1 FL=1